jgi:hypothetical protein
MANLNDAWFYRLKAAQRDLIKLAGGIERAAEITSMSKSQVGRWNNAGDAELISLPAALLLEAECGQAPVTAVMARMNGRRLSDPDAEARAEACVWQSHAETARKAAELLARGALAMADGKVTAAEAVEIDGAARDLINAAGELRKATAGVRAAGLAVIGGAA